MTDTDIQSVSLYKFKQFIKKKAKELMIEYLSSLQQKHSKSKDLDVEDLEMSPYLCDPRFNKTEREILFKLRSRTIQTKENFQNAYLNNDMLCELCKLFPCTQFHPLQCPSLMTKISEPYQTSHAIDTSHTGYLDNILCCIKILVCYNYLFFGF